MTRITHLQSILRLGCVAGVLSLCGCGEGESAPPPDPSTQQPASKAKTTPEAKAAADPEEIEQHFPKRDLWGKAGVNGGVPEVRTAATVAVGDDIQAAIDAAENGAVELAAGEHVINKRLTLKPGVVLRGGENTVIRYGSEGDSVAVQMSGGSKAGIENIRFVYADPRGLADGAHRNDQTYANAPGFPPTPEAAIQFTDATDCWVRDVRVDEALSHPLALRRCSQVTVRDVELHGVLNRGVDAGSLVIDDCEGVLLLGVSIRGLRHIHLVGPASAVVLEGLVSSAGVYMENADLVRDCLIEDCHFLFRPGYPFAPVAKSAMPAGPNNLVASCTTYHHGTDALGGNVMQPGQILEIMPYATKPNADRHAKRNVRGFVTPYRYVKTLPVRQRDVTTIEPTWTEAPRDVKVVKLRVASGLDNWAWTTSVGQGVTDVAVADLIKQPLVVGESRELLGKQVQVGWTESKKDYVLGGFTDSFSANRKMGQFGWEAVPRQGGEVDLLGRADGDWEGGLALQRVVHIPGEPLVQMDRRIVGCEVRIFLGDTELQPGVTYRLKPGYHPLTVLAAIKKQMALIETSTMELIFELQPEAEAVQRVLEVPMPPSGRIYPQALSTDPLAAERAALKAWPDFFKNVLWSTPLPDVIQRTEAFIKQHDGTHPAWVAEGILGVLKNAPHRENETLSDWEWGRLLDYYARSGMPERKWRGLKSRKDAKEFREFYPEQIEEQ